VDQATTPSGRLIALLRFLRWTADAREVAEIFGGDDLAERRAAAPLLGGSPPEFARVILRVGRGRGRFGERAASRADGAWPRLMR